MNYFSSKYFYFSSKKCTSLLYILYKIYIFLKYIPFLQNFLRRKVMKNQEEKYTSGASYSSKHARSRTCDRQCLPSTSVTGTQHRHSHTSCNDKNKQKHYERKSKIFTRSCNIIRESAAQM